MRFWEIDIAATSQGIEVLTGLLEELGVSGMVVSDPRDFEEFLNKTQTYWDYVDESLMELRDAAPHLTFYLPQNAQGEQPAGRHPAGPCRPARQGCGGGVWLP